MWFSPSIRHVSRSKIHIYSCSQHILMTTITPTTSIKVVSVFIANLKVFQNTDLRLTNFTFQPLGEEMGMMLRFQRRNIGLLYRSIRRVKSLKRTLYSLPKTILISPYTPLHDVNVTSIYNNTRTHNSNIFYIRQIYILISSWKEGRNRCGFIPFPFTPYEITICFMNRILLFSNDD